MNLRNTIITSSRLFFALICLVFVTSCTRVATHSGPYANAGNPWTIHGVLRTGNTQTLDVVSVLERVGVVDLAQ